MSVVDTAALRATAEAVECDGDHLWYDELDTDGVNTKNPGDVAYIRALSPPTVLALLAELDTLRATVARIEALAEPWASSGCVHLNTAWGDLRAALVSPTPDPTTP